MQCPFSCPGSATVLDFLPQVEMAGSSALPALKIPIRRSSAVTAGRQSHRRSGSPSQFAPDPLESGVSPESEQFRTADGVGCEPTNDFRRCRFSRSAKGAEGLSARTALKTCPKRSQGSRERVHGPPTPERETEPNRVTTSQIETTHQTSQRQVATGLSRNDSKWL